uniref:Uncharacterized protein n=1 Tax=Rhizophora mucronata TaxID=61149 RepID=A0A2P2N4M2_RHIMU
MTRNPSYKFLWFLVFILCIVLPIYYIKKDLD